MGQTLSTRIEHSQRFSPSSPVLDMVRLALLQPLGAEFFLKSETGRELVDRFVLFSL